MIAHKFAQLLYGILNQARILSQTPIYYKIVLYSNPNYIELVYLNKLYWWKKRKLEGY